jgi:hypothetical protein
MAGTSASSMALSAVLQKIRDREEQQKSCRHVFKAVPGTTAYLQCPKCGKRCDND